MDVTGDAVGLWLYVVMQSRHTKPKLLGIWLFAPLWARRQWSLQENKAVTPRAGINENRSKKPKTELEMPFGIARRLGLS